MFGGRPWLLDVYNQAVFTTPQCIVRDEYTERESGVICGERVVDIGQQ